MRLSKNFQLIEFTRSNTADKHKIVNGPNNQQIECLKKLCTQVLQPLREMYGEAFIINSGYRCAELNKVVGGVPTSQHTKGQAADVRVKEPRKLFDMLRVSGLIFDQIILYPTFVHISYCEGKNRKQVLYAKGVKP